MSALSHSPVCSRRKSESELPRCPPTPRITTFPPVPVTCDVVRNKCREMLTAALRTEGEFTMAGPGRAPPGNHECGWAVSWASLPDDHVTVGADYVCLSAQIEEYILRGSIWGSQAVTLHQGEGWAHHPLPVPSCLGPVGACWVQQPRCQLALNCLHASTVTWGTQT